MAKENIQENNQKEPRVTLMGEEISPRERRRREHHGVVGGILLIFVGLLLFLNSLGIVPWEVWRVILQFWPLLLVLLGIQIILGNNIVSRFILAFLSIILFGSVILLALQETAPQLIGNLPPELNNLIDVWKGLKK